MEWLCAKKIILTLHKYWESSELESSRHNLPFWEAIWHPAFRIKDFNLGPS
jgi:hypothetical protein